MTRIPVSVVCCEPVEPWHSRIVEISMDSGELDRRVLKSLEQEMPAGAVRELHNAAHDPEHGPVTYVQQVHDGGFAVLVGPPGQLKETFFGPGSYVAFMDDRGPGHGSRVGPQGVRRTLRVLKGHLVVA
ncbi:MAG: hypothetical protein J0L84_09690 [Verrucomicrobia bacterium]|nr:hypothetical protein [Verrucomicrobiota bacterium]